MTAGNRQSGGSQLYWVADNIIANDFPPVSCALRDPDGLLAIGGDLSTGRLLDAYQRGIFPWYSSGQPILWWSPDPRCVLEPDALRISRSLRKTLRKGQYQVTFNQAFRQVIQACSEPRSGQEGTWITPEMMDAYINLYDIGQALSVESWYGDRLAGGLYGVVIGRVFFGESMFSRQSDASKVALVHLVEVLKQKQFRLIDCQLHSRHLQTLGAKPVQRGLFINILKHYCIPVGGHDWPQRCSVV
ncbi:MAG: leucyl/phenylalanyl-tRNA--protein transferase [Gammaproteobacteria bacterium]